MLSGTQFLMEIEENGVPFSKSHLEEANQQFTDEIFELNEKLYEYKEVCDHLYQSLFEHWHQTSMQSQNLSF